MVEVVPDMLTMIYHQHNAAAESGLATSFAGNSSNLFLAQNRWMRTAGFSLHFLTTHDTWEANYIKLCYIVIYIIITKNLLKSVITQQPAISKCSEMATQRYTWKFTDMSKGPNKNSAVSAERPTEFPGDLESSTRTFSSIGGLLENHRKTIGKWWFNELFVVI